MLRGGDMSEIQELHRQGLSVTQIHALTGFARSTVRKYLKHPGTPRYSPRPKQPGKLEPFLPFLEERLRAGVWNAVVLLRELQGRGYTGGYTTLKEYLHPRRRAAFEVAVRRFETPPGHQAQVDWGVIGRDETGGVRRPLSCFVLTLGHSRAMFSDLSTDQTLETLLGMHEAAFGALGGVPHEVLYDHMKTVVLGLDERGEVKWHPTFLDFAHYWGFAPRLCRPYRPQTKGKVESGVGYVKKNFLPGREAAGLEDLRGQHREWLWGVANRRVHGTTHRRVDEAWEGEKPHLQPAEGRPPYPLEPQIRRKVARDAYVSYRGSRYSVPWPLAGQEVRLKEAAGRLEVYRERERVAIHALDGRPHQVVTDPAHHCGIPTGEERRPKGQILLIPAAPAVEVRPLAVYEQFAGVSCGPGMIAGGEG